MSDDYQSIQASLGTQDPDENIFKDKDPFSKSWEDLKELSGIDVNFKRRTTRTINKSLEPTNAYLDSA